MSGWLESVGNVFSSAGGEGVRSVQIDGWDIATIVAYFTLVMGIGIFSLTTVSAGTEEGYFLAGRFMTWIPVGASLFATNIGSEHYVGLSGSGAQAGIGVGAFELNALFLLPVLGWIFIPVFIASGASTLPEYMNKRYGGQRIRMVLSVVSLVMYIFTKNSVDMYSGALFIQQAIGWNLYLSIFLLLGMTVLSTLTGGLAAVIYTDTLQCFIMILGAVVLCVLGMMEVGGFEALYYKYPRAVSNDTMNLLLAGNSTECGVPPKDAWTMLRQPLDDEMPWAGFVFGQTTSSLWYWCADQMMVQRVLAAKTLSHAQGGCLFCGYIKILPLFAMIMPGMISRVLYANDVACSTAESCKRICESTHSCSNIAYPKLVLGVMPPGLRGFMIAVMLSATMSDLSSTFNSASTLFTMDLYKHIRKGASLKELMIVGRVSVVAVVAVGVGTIPLVQMAQGDQLFTYIQAITNYFSPPIAAIYLVAICWGRSNEAGTFWALTTGFLIGIVRMIIGFIWTAPECGEPDARPSILKDFHYMYYALFIFWYVIIVNVVVSLLTAPTDEERQIRTLFVTRHDRTIRQDEYVDDDPDFEEKVRAQEERKQELIKNPPPKLPMYRRVINFLCGVDSEEHEAPLMSSKQHMKMLQEMTLLTQDRKSRYLLWAGAVFLMTIGLFMYIFFSIEWYVKLKPLYFDWLDH